MWNSRGNKRRPFANQVNRFIGEFTDLKYNGVKIICLVCDKPLMCWDKTDCRKHINTTHHKFKKSGATSRTDFLFDFIFMLMACNLPFNLLNQPSFQRFWKEYNPTTKLPGRKTLQTYIPSVREKIENVIKTELHDKKLWLCVDLMIDCKKNSVINVVVRTLEPHKPSCSFLLASKRLQPCTGKAIAKVVLNVFEKFHLSQNQLLMFVTVSAAPMHSVGLSLKQECGNLLHITCKLHALHIVAEEIQRCYPSVNGLISSTKAVFLKSSKYIREFRKQCSNVPVPSQSILTRWGSWLKTALYYFEHYHKIRTVVLQFDSKEAAVVKECQAIFQDPQVEMDLQAIHNNYRGIVEAIEKLQNPSLSLVDSLQIVDNVYSLLCGVNDAKNNRVRAKFDSILKEDSDFARLRQMCSVSASTDSLDNCSDCFNYANITSFDVERSFSSYKLLFTPRRTSLAETTVETYLMLQMFSQAKGSTNVV